MNRVILLNVWHDDNAGDSAIAQICVEAAKKKWPGAKIEIRTMLGRNDPAYESWNRHLKVRFPDAEFLPAFYPEPHSSGRFRKLSVVLGILRAVYLGLGVGIGPRKTVRSYISGAEAVVLVGGSDLFEVRRPVTSQFRLRRITEAAIDAARVGVPVYLWGHTLGPFETKFGKSIARQLFESSKQILVRDEKSAEIALELSGRNNVELVPDFGFAIQPGTVPSVKSGHIRGRYVAIVPRKHFFDGDGSRTDGLLDELANFARGLLEREEVDSIVLVSQVTGPSILEDDRVVVEELASKIKDSRVEVLDTSKFGPSEFCGLYAKASGVVAVRLHGAILAMAGGTPALAIAYFTGKTSGVMEGMGFGDSWVEFDDCTSTYMGEWWGKVSSSHRAGAIEAAVDKARTELNRTIGVEV